MLSRLVYVFFYIMHSAVTCAIFVTAGLKPLKVNEKQTTKDEPLRVMRYAVTVWGSAPTVREAPSRLLEDEFLSHGIVDAAHAACAACGSSWSFAQTWHHWSYPVDFR